MQSYLGNYSGAATNRESKLVRAIDSVLNQTLKDFELIVVADGCEKTFDIVSKEYEDNDQVECFLIKKQPLWSGRARNFGLIKAQGDYVVYLDGDDYFGENHLQKISDQIADEDWFYFNDIVLNNRGDKIERRALIKQKFQAGTSNICHKNGLGITWAGNAYGLDDWTVIQSLEKYPNRKQINTPEYYCCHIPFKVDV